MTERPMAPPKRPRLLPALAILVALGACGRADHFGKPPSFSPQTDDPERRAMLDLGLPRNPAQAFGETASLWSGSRGSLLGDRRAGQRGDILTVVIEIDEEAEISNTTDRSRASGSSLAIPQLLGLPQLADERLPAGASLANAVSTSSSSQSNGAGSVRRNEKLTLRIAATVTGVLPNGVLEIAGQQEVRVNFEMRELLVSGFVRPEDITRQNEVTYDKIAAARISYGGRGQISDVQQPRWGQQAMDAILPF